MTDFVVDASMALKWFFIDEADDVSQRLFLRLSSGAAIVPELWPLEMTNALLAAERARRITSEDLVSAISRIQRLPIKIDGETASRAFSETLKLAREQTLTAYDAAYLELATRVNLPLATADRDLIRAARKLGANLVT